jgi:hypothetical protein
MESSEATIYVADREFVYKTAVAQKCLTHTHCEARLNFVNWCLCVVHDGEMGHTLFLFSDETW